MGWPDYSRCIVGVDYIYSIDYSVCVLYVILFWPTFLTADYLDIDVLLLFIDIWTWPSIPDRTILVLTLWPSFDAFYCCEYQVIPIDAIPDKWYYIYDDIDLLDYWTPIISPVMVCRDDWRLLLLDRYCWPSDDIIDDYWLFCTTLIQCCIIVLCVLYPIPNYRGGQWLTSIHSIGIVLFFCMTLYCESNIEMDRTLLLAILLNDGGVAYVTVILYLWPWRLCVLLLTGDIYVITWWPASIQPRNASVSNGESDKLLRRSEEVHLLAIVWLWTSWPYLTVIASGDVLTDLDTVVTANGNGQYAYTAWRLNWPDITGP